LTEEVFTHKCPNCGGALTFNPDDQKFHCPFCLSVFNEEEVTRFEEAQKKAHLQTDNAQVNEATEEVKDGEDMSLFLCPSCGAEIVTDASTSATYCYYCHNPVVLQSRISGKFLPEKLIPFRIDKEKAVELFLGWTQKKHFVPRDFFNKEQISLLTGVYFPYWLIDSDLDGKMTADARNVRVWVAGDVEYTETKQYRVERDGHLHFDQLIKNALSKNVQQKMVETVQPFDIQESIAFKSQYLAGFQAEKRDIEFESIKENVEKELVYYSQQLLKDSVGGYQLVTNENFNIVEKSIHQHYVLLPLWILTYQAKNSDKVYYFALNAQTGKVSGVLPYSLKKLILVASVLFIVCLILGLIGGYFI